MFWLGLTSANQWPYLLWSGVLGDLGIIGSLLANAAILARRHQCEVYRCWRLGRHAGPGGHMLCRRHHPDGHLRPEDVGPPGERVK